VQTDGATRPRCRGAHFSEHGQPARDLLNDEHGLVNATQLNSSYVLAAEPGK
jgi:hypothetical protein